VCVCVYENIVCNCVVGYPFYMIISLKTRHLFISTDEQRSTKFVDTIKAKCYSNPSFVMF